MIKKKNLLKIKVSQPQRVIEKKKFQFRHLFLQNKNKKNRKYFNFNLKSIQAS